MEFKKTKSYLRKTKDGVFAIGDNPLSPVLTIDGNQLLVTSLNVDGSLVEGITKLKEAFELNSDGDLTPVDSDAISDTMWMLDANGDLQLRANHFHQSWQTAFRDEIIEASAGKLSLDDISF